MFGSPLVPLLLVAGLMVGVYLLLGARERGGQASKGKGGSRGKKTPPRRNQPRWIRQLPVVLLIGAVGCLVVALTQFRLSTRESQATVMLVVDASESMNQTDVTPNRLAAAEDAARTFLDQLPDNLQVGLVTFADVPAVLVQPTTDHARVDAALVAPPRGKGTVIGDGLTSALDAIAAEQGTNGGGSAAIVLLSDGRDTGSQVAPDAAAARASAAGIKVYTVALGEATGTGGANLDLLEQIADTTGAQISTAATAGELNQVYESLGTQISTELKISNSAQLFVIIAVLLGLGAGVAVLLTSRPQF